MYTRISKGIASIVAVTMLFADGFGQAEMLRGSTEWLRNDSENLLASKNDLELSGLRVEVVRK
jgi:hypothetical protein